MTTRLTLLGHAATAATRAGAFPDDEPVEAAGIAAAEALGRRLPRFGRVLASPCRRSRETVAALGLAAEEVGALRDADYGCWCGRTIADVAATEPEAVAVWMSDPRAAPHGGESIEALVRRVGAWLDAADFSGRVLAVTHAAVARAVVVHVLAAPMESFWRVDAGPLSSLDLRRNDRRWSLRATSHHHED